MVIPSFFLIVLCICLRSLVVEARLQRSIPFHLADINFGCPSVQCKFPLMQDATFHLVVGTNHESYFPTLVNRVCEAFQKCISVKNMKIIVQAASKDLTNTPSFVQGSVFLHSLGIKYIIWAGTFTGDKKMLHTFRALKDVDENSFIYQTDIDEIPDPKTLKRAMEQLASGKCNAIRARWADRLALGGELKPITLSGNSSMGDQFPLRCRISPNFVGQRVEKVIVYSAAYRIDGGHHEVWCSPLSGLGSKGAKSLKAQLEEEAALKSGNLTVTDMMKVLTVNSGEDNENVTSNYRRICSQHIKGRQKQAYYRDIMDALPEGVEYPAKYCSQIVILDHFKFVEGMQSYLRTRWETYRAKNIPWWTDSWRFLTHIERHNNTVCVDCVPSKCYNAHTRKKLAIDRTKKFYCGIHGQPCSTPDGFHITDVGTKAYKEALKAKDAAVTATLQASR